MRGPSGSTIGKGSGQLKILCVKSCTNLTKIKERGVKMEWLIDSNNTKVNFSIKNFWGLMTVKGSFKAVVGHFNFDPANPSGWSAQAKIETASLDTRNARRDKDLRSARFLDAASYPYLTFRSSKIEPSEAGTFHLHGELTVRNVTRPVVLEVTYPPTSANGK